MASETFLLGTGTTTKYSDAMAGTLAATRSANSDLRSVV